MATPRQWYAAARPRTLPAAVVPIVVGTAIARDYGGVRWAEAAGALGVALAIQVGTNYANDYSDGVRGTDRFRAGPARLVASGLAAPVAVRRAAVCSFGVAAALGLAVAASTSLWLVVVGAASIAAGWFYTGGRHPYGYAGLGEVFVFVFFGLVSVVGSTYVAAGRVPALAYLAAVPVGLLTVALLVVNNLRDIPTDAASGKRTLAVHMGDAATRRLYVGLVAVAFVLVAPIAAVRPAAVIALLALMVARRPVALVRSGVTSAALVPALAGTGALMLGFGALLAAGLCA